MNTSMKKLIEELRTLADTQDKPEYRQYGVCNVIRRNTRDMEVEQSNYAYALMDEWPENSGSIFYPVRHPTMPPHRAFDLPDLWEDTEYGRARRRLCGYLAARLEAGENK